MLNIFRSPVVALCLVVFGIFLIYAGHKNAKEFAALREHGETASAEITQLQWQEKQRSHEDSGYTASIRFTSKDGVLHQETKGIATELGRAIRNKTAPPVMNVRYLPESPSTFRQVGEDDTSEAEGGVGRYMLLGGILLLAIRFFFRKKEQPA